MPPKVILRCLLQLRWRIHSFHIELTLKKEVEAIKKENDALKKTLEYMSKRLPVIALLHQRVLRHHLIIRLPRTLLRPPIYRLRFNNLPLLSKNLDMASSRKPLSLLATNFTSHKRFFRPCIHIVKN